MEREVLSDAPILGVDAPFSSSNTPRLPYVDNTTFLVGGLDPAIDDNIHLVPTLKEPEKPVSSRAGLFALQDDNDEVAFPPARESFTTLPMDSSDTSVSSKCYIFNLPSELIDHIYAFLGPTDLASVSKTCSFLHECGKSDLVWQRHVQDNIPGVRITSPFPCKSYRELYITHDPRWFLPKYKIWFCDYFLTGKVIITRYDPRRGCIEGYRLVAERTPPTFDPWEYNPQVLIHSFNPRCRLHKDQPVIQLDALSLESLVTSRGNTRPAHRFYAEIPMRVDERLQSGVFSNFLLARPVEARPNMQLWPPLTIPSRHRVRNASQEAFVGTGHKPQQRSEVSNQCFRIRRWMEMAAGQHPGVHLGEEVYTYATLDPKLYTPTEEKPFRGIWVGDYSGHGCEFLLMNQPDNEEPFDEDSVVQRDDETVEEWKIRKREEKIYRGSLEAIKLTGDPNVPRGELTFVSDDLSNNSLVRVATEERFKGCRIVQSKGHIAATMYRDDKYIETQMIVISHDKIAQYWIGFGHISFYERVNIDGFLSPMDDPPLIATATT